MGGGGVEMAVMGTLPSPLPPLPLLPIGVMDGSSAPPLMESSEESGANPIPFFAESSEESGGVLVSML